MIDVLRLIALPDGCDDDPTCDFARNVGTMIALDNVQAEIESGGEARGGQNVSVVDVQDIGLRSRCLESASWVDRRELDQLVVRADRDLEVVKEPGESE